IRARVRRNAADGADLIKVMVTGGHLTPGGANMWESQFSAAELRAVVEEARGLGPPVAAHAHGTDGIVSAVEARVDTIEHCTWIRDGRVDVREDVAAEIVAKGIAVSPAIGRGWRTFPER